MRIHDISLPLSEQTPAYPGDPPFSLRRVADMAHGDAFNLSAVAMSAHAGTHVDAPSHVSRGMPVDEVPLETLIGPALVADVAGEGSVTAERLEGCAIPAETRRLLLKTRSGRLAPPENAARQAAFLDEGAARWIVRRGIRLLGVDTLSVDRPGDQALVAHRVLLEAGVIIVEGLELSGVRPGDYTLVCLPVKLQGSDGAPARAVLVRGTLALDTQQISWLERAQKLVAYHQEALGFIQRIGQQLPASPSDALAVGRLWLEAEKLDPTVCGLLDEMNVGLLGGKGELDTTRGASLAQSPADDRLVYECTWSLRWEDSRGVSVDLAMDSLSEAYYVTVRGLQSGQAERVRFPLDEAELKEALVNAYVADATCGSGQPGPEARGRPG